MFDFQKAILAANAAVEGASSRESSSSYKYPLVYPQPGQTLVVRPLFNPKSGQIVRLISRHEKVACYRTYGTDCPICNVQQQVKDVTGQDPFGRNKRSKSRGVCFAQYISSTSPIEKGNNQTIAPGEIVLLMFPWSVYTQINTIIQAIGQTPTGMDQAFCHASQGFFIQISVTNDFKYTTTNVPYMTFSTNQTDDQFMEMLENLDDLYEQVLPSTITEEVDKQVREYSDAIYRQYIAPSVPNQAPYVSPGPVSYSPNPAQPAVKFSDSPVPLTIDTPNNFPTASVAINTPVTYPSYNASEVGPTVSATSSRPACFGKHMDNNPQCICCPDEVLCIGAASGSSGV